MPRLPRRLGRLAGLALVPASLLATGLLITSSSSSLFNATTGNAANTWSTGMIALSDDDSATAMFTAPGLRPGSAGSKCIAVTSSGSVPSSVKLYTTAYSTTNALGSYLDVTITQGTGGSFSSCSGFTPLASGSAVYTGTLANLAASNTSYANGLSGVSAWSPSGAAPETRVFKIDYAVNSSATNASQNSTAAVGFTWEAQNN